MRRNSGSRGPGLCPVVLLVAMAIVAPASSKERLRLRHESIDLPGAPAVILATDLDRDGIRDLVVALAYTEWDQIDFEEQSEMQGIDGLVSVMTVIPSLMDRRELWVFLAAESGGYRTRIGPLPLDLSVLTVDKGPPDTPVIALTDSGLASLRIDEANSRLWLEPILPTTPVMARSATLIPNLGIVHDLDSDQRLDWLVPRDEGLEVLLAEGNGSFRRASIVVTIPGGRTRPRPGLTRFYPLPVVRDVDGNGLPDLLVPDRIRYWDDFAVLRNKGNGKFSQPVRPNAESIQPSDRDPDDQVEVESVVYFGDLDGDGIAEYLTEQSLEDPDAGWRKEVKEAKRPPRRYRIYRSEADLGRAPEATSQFDATGYAFDLEDSDIRLPGGFQDLNGDGRQDLITMTLDFSLFQAFKILTTQRIGVGLDFFIWCQDEQGEFRAVPDLDLSGKFKINLKNLQLSQMSQFGGDFDGDDRIDFLQVGRGKTVTIHRGGDDCSYPSEPDLAIRLEEAPVDLSLVQVRDLDGDGLADLMITQPQKSPEAGVTAPVRLDLYLSGNRP